MTIVLNLPMPPSTNRLWRSTRKGIVYKETKAKNWCEQAAWAVLAQRKGVTLKGNVSVMLEIEYGEGDADNRIKAVLDMLERGGLLENDSQVVCGTWTWSNDVSGIRVTVEETKKIFSKKLKPRQHCPCGAPFDPRGKPTCDCDEVPATPQKARAA